MYELVSVIEWGLEEGGTRTTTWRGVPGFTSFDFTQFTGSGALNRVRERAVLDHVVHVDRIVNAPGHVAHAQRRGDRAVLHLARCAVFHHDVENDLGVPVELSQPRKEELHPIRSNPSVVSPEALYSPGQLLTCGYLIQARGDSFEPACTAREVDQVVDRKPHTGQASRGEDVLTLQPRRLGEHQPPLHVPRRPLQTLPPDCPRHPDSPYLRKGAVR